MKPTASTPRERARCAALYRAGCSIAECARQCGRSPGWVYTALYRERVERRRRGRA